MSKVHKTPGDLFANIPGILGFYPQESLVVASHIGHVNARTTLGPVMRIDLADLDDATMLCHAKEMLSGADVDFLMLLCVTKEANPQQRWGEAMRAFAAMAASIDVPIEGTWVVGELTTGEQLQPWSEQDGWGEGALGNIASSQSMQRLLTSGTLPAITREELFGYFDTSIDERTAEQKLAIQHRAEMQAANLVEDLEFFEFEDEAEIVMGDLMWEWEDLLETVVDDELTVEEIIDDAELLLTGMKFMAEVTLRDVVLGTSSCWDQPVKTVLLAVIRSSVGTMRAHALAAFALFDLRKAGQVHAVPALITALQCCPDHGLATLALEACNRGMQEELRCAVREAAASLVERFMPDNNFFCET